MRRILLKLNIFLFLLSCTPSLSDTEKAWCMTSAQTILIAEVISTTQQSGNMELNAHQEETYQTGSRLNLSLANTLEVKGIEYATNTGVWHGGFFTFNDAWLTNDNLIQNEVCKTWYEVSN